VDNGIWRIDTDGYLCGHYLNQLFKNRTMKKFLAVLAIAGTLVACGNDANNTENADTTTTNTTITADTTTLAPVTGDTTGAGTIDTTGATAGTTDSTTR
jgi:hypothetical protein